MVHAGIKSLYKGIITSNNTINLTLLVEHLCSS
jgi:hypothetical protein